MQCRPQTAWPRADDIDMACYGDCAFARFCIERPDFALGFDEPAGVVACGSHFALQVENHVVRPAQIAFASAVQRKPFHFEVENFFGVHPERFRKCRTDLTLLVEG